MSSMNPKSPRFAEIALLLIIALSFGYLLGCAVQKEQIVKSCEVQFSFIYRDRMYNCLREDGETASKDDAAYTYLPPEEDEA